MCSSLGTEVAADGPSESSNDALPLSKGGKAREDDQNHSGGSAGETTLHPAQAGAPRGEMPPQWKSPRVAAAGDTLGASTSEHSPERGHSPGNSPGSVLSRPWHSPQLEISTVLQLSSHGRHCPSPWQRVTTTHLPKRSSFASQLGLSFVWRSQKFTGRRWERAQGANWSLPALSCIPHGGEQDPPYAPLAKASPQTQHPARHRSTHLSPGTGEGHATAGPARRDSTRARQQFPDFVCTGLDDPR